MLSYDEVLQKAWRNILENYENNLIDFDNESTLRSHLFAECLQIMKEESFETPFKIYAERCLMPGKIPIERFTEIYGYLADLVLGDNEIAVELKIVSRTGPQPSPSSVKKDLDKLSMHANWGEVAYFLALDLQWSPHYRSPIETGLKRAGIATAGEERYTRDGRKYMAFLVKKTKSKKERAARHH